MTDRETATLSLAHRILLALSVLGVAGLVIYKIGPRAGENWFMLMSGLGWLIFPFVLAFLTKSAARRVMTSALTYLALSLLSSLVALSIYVQTLFFEPPGEHLVLIFVVVPICQVLLIPCLFVIVSAFVERKRH